ncbi:MAG: hypothetical protein R3B36_32780 [Polyangiaceae bacterium]
MEREELVGRVKEIIALGRAGDQDAATNGYGALFADPRFVAARVEDQRQALRMFVLAKRHGAMPPAVVEVHRAALVPLTELVSLHNEPEDYEMLGVCHLAIGNEAAAANLFREGLTLERARNAASDLCGRLMTRVSAL